MSVLTLHRKLGADEGGMIESLQLSVLNLALESFNLIRGPLALLVFASP